MSISLLFMFSFNQFSISSSICGKCFSDTYLRREHEKIHTSNSLANVLKIQEGGKLLYACPKCSDRFERGGKVFENHIEKCNGILRDKKRSYRYPCVECKKSFVTKIACADHLLDVHKINIGNIEKFCFICNAEFEDPFMHSRSHTCAFQCQMVSI